MSRTKEADLISALYLFASRCWAEGDLSALRNMGFGREEIEDLLSLNLSDLQRLCNMNGHPLRVELDADTFRLIVEHLRRERRREEILCALILADAPLPMMQTLYGMTAKEYTGWRQVLSMPAGAGRPPDADEAASHRVWHAWTGMLGERDPQDLEPAEFLALYRDTEVPLRSLWNLVQHWSTRGAAQLDTDPDEGAPGDWLGLHDGSG